MFLLVTPLSLFLTLDGLNSMPFSERPILIAHRGGVVDEERSENSLKALEEAIRRGYSHVEVDARVTADGHVVCFHSDALMDEAGVDGRISEMPRDAVTQVVLTRSGEQIPTFEDYCARCAGRALTRPSPGAGKRRHPLPQAGEGNTRESVTPGRGSKTAGSPDGVASGRIGIMVDLKGCPDAFVERYTDEIEAALDAHGLLKDAMILINKEPVDNQDRIAQRFLGKAQVSWRATLEQTQATLSGQRLSPSAVCGPPSPDLYYVLNHGEDFTRQDVEGFHALGFRVIPSINTYHYRDGGPMALGSRHIEQLMDWGVDGFEIDSCYDCLFFGSA